MTPFESERFVIFEDPAAFWQVNPKYLATFGQPHFLFYSASSQLSNLVAVLLEELDPLSPRLASRVNDWHISAEGRYRQPIRLHSILHVRRAGLAT